MAESETGVSGGGGTQMSCRARAVGEGGRGCCEVTRSAAVASAMAALLLVGFGQAVRSPVETPDEAPERAVRESESAQAENTRNPARDTAATEEANADVDSILTQTAVNAANDDMEASQTIDTTAATDRSSGEALD